MNRTAQIDFDDEESDPYLLAEKFDLFVKVNPVRLQNGCLEVQLYGEEENLRNALIEYNGGDENILEFYID